MKQKQMFFVEFSSFFYDPMDVGHLVSGFSAFSKFRLYIWKLSVHVLLKTSLWDFEHYFCWHALCCAWLLSNVRLFVTPWTVAFQAPLSMGILQARILEWVAMPSSRGSSQPRDRTQVSCTAGGFFTTEPPQKPRNTGVGSLSLLHGIIPTKESNQGLLHHRWILYQLSYKGSPASMWNECNCVVVWTFFGTALLCNLNENWPFPALWPLLSFPNLLAYWLQHFHSIIF